MNYKRHIIFIYALVALQLVAMFLYTVFNVVILAGMAEYVHTHKAIEKRHIPSGGGVIADSYPSREAYDLAPDGIYEVQREETDWDRVYQQWLLLQRERQ